MSTSTSSPSAPTAEADSNAAAMHRALLAGSRPAPVGALTAVRAFAWRGRRRLRHVPEQLLDATVTPAMFVIMFTYLFGGAIAGSTGAYLHYILPGILVMSVLFTTVYSGVAVNIDMTKGVIDRFRSLPVWRAASLVGALVGDAMRYLLAGTVIIVLGLALGYRPEAGVWGAASALAVVVLFAFGLSWVFTTAGLLMRSPNAVMNAGNMVIFPLAFLSNLFVEPETLPGPLAAFVEVNPLSLLATTARGLMDGNAQPGHVTLVLVLALALTAVFAPLTTYLYARG
jgi:ABC-2 type transport system permease protein